MGLVSVGVTGDQGFNRIRIPDFYPEGTENTLVLGSRFGNALFWVQSWGVVWKSLDLRLKI